MSKHYTRISPLGELPVFGQLRSKKIDYKLELQTGHLGAIKRLQLNSDNRTIMSLADDNAVVLWDKESGRQIRVITGSTCRVVVNYLGAGRSATGGDSSWRKKIRHIDDIRCDRTSIKQHLGNGARIESFKEIRNQITTATLSPNGEFVLTGGSDSHLKLYDSNTGQLLVSYNDLNGQPILGSIQLANFDPDGKYIVSAGHGEEGELGLWNVKTSELINSVHNTAQFSYISFVPNADAMVISTEVNEAKKGAKLKLWDMRQGVMLREFIGHESGISAVAISRDGKSIVSGDKAGHLILWEADTGKKVNTLKLSDSKISGIELSDDGRLAVVAINQTLQRIDLFSGNTEVLISENKNVTTFAYTPDGRYGMVGLEEESRFSLWDFSENRVIRRFFGRAKPVGNVRYSTDDQYILMYSDPPRYWDLRTGREGTDNNVLAQMNIENEAARRNIADELRRLRASGFDSSAIKQRINIISPNQKFELKKTSTNGFTKDTFTLIERSTGKPACRLPHPAMGLYDTAGEAVFSRNGNFIIGERYKNNLGWDEVRTAFIWHVESCQVVHYFTKTTIQPLSEVLLDSPDGKYVFLSNESNNPVLFKVANLIQNTETASYFTLKGEEKNMMGAYTLGDYRGELSSLHFSTDSKRLLSGGKDIKITLWDVATGNNIANILPLHDTRESIIYTEDHHYISSKRAFMGLSITSGLQTYSFEQFDLKLNRPDLVLEKLTGVESEMSKAYYSAYQKRLKKMDLTEEMLGENYHVPEVVIKNSVDIGLSSGAEEVTFEIEAKDNKYPLSYLHVWVNDVPIYGRRGLELKTDTAGKKLKTVKIKLSSGTNKIQFSAVNQRGTASLKAEKTIFSTQPKKKPALHVVAIGVSEYQDAEMNLNYAAKDATDFIALFQSRKDLFSSVSIYKFTDQEAVTDRIRESRHDLMATEVDDVVLVFYAGHGMLDKDYNYYLATHNTDFINPSVNGLGYEELEDLIDGIPARNKVVFIDACYSGEVDKDDIQEVFSQFITTGPVKFSQGFRSTKGRNVLGLDKSFTLSRELFVDLRRRSGATVISSAGGAELAVENEQWKNGVFSYCLFDGLREQKIDQNQDNRVMVSELHGYLSMCVADLTHNLQRPTSRAENISNDFQIW